ncbi:MAG: hypothetical protein EHV01_002160 [Spiroplasma sp. hy2]|uniref:hypothetical protein n=1 Tax=Spiroplasma sp. hy2 TaxID=2490850 RepID=UPI00383E10F8
MRKEKIIFNYIIAIDPAGIGQTGIIAYDVKQKYIYQHITIESKSDENAVENIYNWINKILDLKNVLIIIENFQIWPNLKIKNVLSTPLCIGGLKALFKYKFNWPIILQEPNVRGTIKLNYKGNIKMSEHELDAWKHLQYFLKKESDKNAKSSKQFS